jgi:hypothetical protein
VKICEKYVNVEACKWGQTVIDNFIRILKQHKKINFPLQLFFIDVFKLVKFSLWKMCFNNEHFNKYLFSKLYPDISTSRQLINKSIHTLTYFSTCPFGQLTKKSTCPTQSFSCPKKLIKITKTRENNYPGLPPLLN